MTGKELQAIRKATGLTRQAFADKMKISLETLKSYECDRRLIPADRVDRAKFLQQELSKL